MIKKLQLKFVVIIMSIMTIVLLGVFGTINYTMYRSTSMQTEIAIKKIADNDGYMKGGLRPNAPDMKPLFDITEPMPQANFSVKLDEDGNVSEIISDRNHNYTEDEVSEYLVNALDNNNTSGVTGGFKYLIVQKPYGQLIVFLDNSMQINSTARLLWITVFVVLASWLVILVISLFLSKWAINPVKKAYEAQKRFVADASHELKTPLTVISANVDVLSSDIPDSKWLQFIKAETLRMSELVNNLLYLAKSDASEHSYNMSEFNLSDAITNAVLPFESSCYENHKRLSLDVKEGVFFKGDENRIMQVVIILMDNAIKNAAYDGEIKVSLTCLNGKKNISVFNQGDILSDEVKLKIFDRFYRGDSSRDRKNGGYGLGLSIAKTIIDAHKGKIHIENIANTGVRFTIVLP